jgi:hypothetical protein
VIYIMYGSWMFLFVMDLPLKDLCLHKQTHVERNLRNLVYILRHQGNLLNVLRRDT